MQGMYGPYPMERESSGTSWEPEAIPPSGLQWMKKGWMLMFDGYLTGVFDHQGGPRGGNKFFSPNMVMFMADHTWGRHTFGTHTMLSLEPATIGNQGYPLLLQTGETANGVTPLIDRQHPHDFFMEMALSYSLTITPESSFFVYFGMPGEPALGPPTFMHRLSGMEIPEAPITHHWMDSTHVTFGVATLGFTWKDFKLDASIFTGREPDQNRWDMDKPRFDSYSARVSYNPSPNWALQTSYGYMHSPEQLEPDINQHRITASAQHFIAWNRNFSQTTLAWGLNMNRGGNSAPHHNLNAVLLETILNLHVHHNLLARFENVSKDELFEAPNPLAGETFNVSKLSLGYIYDLTPWHHMGWGFGGVGSINFLPSAVAPSYGSRTPMSFMLFVRLRPKS